MGRKDAKQILYGAMKRIAIVLLSFALTLPTAAIAHGDSPETGTNASGTPNRTVSVDPTGRSEGFSAVLYNNTNGLPTSEANAIAETSEGFIWIGSYGGLIRYDGNTFTRMDSTRGLTSVKYLFTDSRDRLWIGTNDNGVGVMERDELQMWGKLDGMSSSHIRAITEDRNGTIYVATNSGITLIDPEGNLSVMKDEPLLQADMRSLRMGSDGIIYGTTDLGDILRIRDGKLLSFLSREDNPSGGVGTIFPDPENPGKIYYEGVDFGFYRATFGDTLTDIETLNIKPLSYVQQMEYIDGKVWICAANGIGVLDHQSFHLLDDLPMNSNVGNVMTDYLGNLWFTSTRQGVMKVVPNQFSDPFERFDLPEKVVNTTCMYGDQLFAGTDQGLIVLGEDGPVSSVPLKKAETVSGLDMGADDLISLLDGVRIRSIIRDSRDRLWISTWRKYGLLRYDHGELAAFTEEEGLLSNSIRAVCEREDGSFLVAVTGGLNIIEKDRVTAAYSDKDGIVNTESLCVECGTNGDIVLGSNGGGLSIINESGVKNINVEEGLPSDIVMRLKRDPERDLIWIVTSSAIAYMTPDYQVTTIQKFPYTNNFDLFENKDGKMWVLSSNGIYVVPTEELLANEEIHPVHYGIANGMPCIATANSYSELTTDGVLYIAGGTGICRVNIDHPFEDVSELKVSIPYVDVDGHKIFPDDKNNFTIPATAQKVTIPSFVFNYSLSDPQVSRRLDGFEKESTTVNRSELVPLDYTNLRGGTYHYVIQLMDSLGRGSKEISIQIKKEKKLFEKEWFILLVATLLVLAAGVGGKYYIRRKTLILEKKNQEALRQNLILQNSEKKLREQMEIISSLANIYNSMYELDLEQDRYREIRSGQSSANSIAKEGRANLQRLVDLVIRSKLDPSCIDREVLEALDLSTINERMQHTDLWTKELMNRDKQWRRGRFIVSKRDADGRISRVLWVSEDIDKERKERERLLDVSERAVAANEAKSSFLSNMSHEIRTPINAVLGMNEMIRRECDNDNILMYSENIRTAGNTLLGLINDILDFSKIEAGKMEILPVQYDLSSTINDLVNMIRVRADNEGLMLKLDFDETMPKFLCGDEVRFKQIVTNILTNAVKYTEKGSVTFSIGYEKIADEPDQIYLDVSVRDTGIGIKPEDMEKLFSEFERIEEKRNRNIEGTGLGMNITTRLLEMMGSKLEVQSVYGEGSTFSFRLKQKVVKWDALGDYTVSYRASLTGRKKYKEKFTAPEAIVLVVDDTAMNLAVFKSLLKRTEVQIDTAGSGDEGLALARRRQYDMIFLDHMMPQKDGIETLHELRAEAENPNLHTPTVCLTANAISGAREQYIEAGFDDYLTKPVDASKLEQMLMDYLPKEKIKAPAARKTEPVKFTEKPTILIADDDPAICTIAASLLGGEFSVQSCNTGAETPQRARELSPDLILLDINLGDMSGFDVLRELRETPGIDSIPVVFLTGASDEAAEIKGFRAGAADFVRKPFVPEVLIRRISRIIILDRLQRGLQAEVRRQTLRAEHLTREMMLALSKTVDAKDHYTNGHSQRVAAYSAEIARRMGKSPLEQQHIYEMGLLHDVGKIGVSEMIINKNSRLTDEEFVRIKDHTVIGSEILSIITEMPELAYGARWHHEKFNGMGYPDRLKGKEIPEAARIICVADCYDAMTSTRTYSTPKKQEIVRSEIERCSGTQFDPEIAAVMLEMIDEDKDYVMNERTADISIWRGSDRLWTISEESLRDETGTETATRAGTGTNAGAGTGASAGAGHGNKAGTGASAGTGYGTKIGGETGTAQEDLTEPEDMLPDWLCSVDGLDTEEGLMRFGSAETYLDTLKIYADNAPDSADEIESLWRSGDLQNTTIKVHAIKSLSRTIGAEEIGALAEKLEFAGKKGDRDTVAAEIDELIARVRTLCDSLAPMRTSPATSDESQATPGGGEAAEVEQLPPISDEELREAYGELRGFAADMDEQSAEFVFDFLEGFSLPSHVRENLREIRRAIDGFDWERVAELLDQEDI